MPQLLVRTYDKSPENKELETDIMLLGDDHIPGQAEVLENGDLRVIWEPARMPESAEG